MNTVLLSIYLGPSSTTTLNSPSAQEGSAQEETVQHHRGRRVAGQGVDMEPEAGGTDITSLRGRPGRETPRGGEQRAAGGPAASVHTKN